MREACRGVDCVIHLAAQTSVPRSVKDPIETNQINVNGTLNVLVAARDAKVRRVVFASSCAVYGKTRSFRFERSAALAPISPYGLSKQMGEAYGRVFQELYGLEFVALRYFNVFGPRQDPGSPYSGVLSLFNAACWAGTQPTVYGDGEQSRDFVYVRKRGGSEFAGRRGKRRARPRRQRRHRKPLHAESNSRAARKNYGPPAARKIRRGARRRHPRFASRHRTRAEKRSAIIQAIRV